MKEFVLKYLNENFERTKFGFVSNLEIQRAVMEEFSNSTLPKVKALLDVLVKENLIEKRKGMNFPLYIISHALHKERKN
jgi:hypothetical protein